jgi:hypothetical protein
MNNDRRSRIVDIQGQISTLIEEVNQLKEEEQDAFDNMPESFQNGERGEKGQAAIDALENVETAMQEVIDGLESAAE